MVIFAGEELTLFGFVKIEEYEKYLENTDLTASRFRLYPMVFA